MSESENDRLVIDEIFVNFKDISGAILSRSVKSKVMWLGKWRNRNDWPLSWLKVQSELKVLVFKSHKCTRTLFLVSTKS